MEGKVTLTIDHPNKHFEAPDINGNNHRFIEFSDKARMGANTEAGFTIIEHYFGPMQSRQKWYKDHQTYELTLKEPDGRIVKSKPINYSIVAREIREKGYFDPEVFSLPPIECRWMDFSLDISFDAQYKNAENDEVVKIVDGTAQEFYGENYPIKPTLDREGRSYSSLLPLLLKRVMKMRLTLIVNSHLALTSSWFLDLRTLISDSISVIEITLNQLYIKAEFDPLPQWNFDKSKLGPRNGRRFRDKLAWVYLIAGRHLGAEAHLVAVNNLREVRNHLMHFDPPSLTLTVEEMTIWLNQVVDVGYLIIKIRKAIGVEPSYDLINYVLQKEALFKPAQDFNGRIPLPNDGSSGYRSTIWKDQEAI